MAEHQTIYALSVSQDSLLYVTGNTMVVEISLRQGQHILTARLFRDDSDALISLIHAIRGPHAETPADERSPEG